MAARRYDQNTYAQIARLWMLRALMEPHQARRLLRILNNSSVLESLGFSPDVLDSEQSRARRLAAIARWVAEEHRAIEAKGPTLPDPLARNLKLLGARFRLNEVEQAILAVRCIAELEENLVECISACESRTDARLAAVLGAMIAVPRDRVEAAISPEASLTSLRLIHHADGIDGFTERVNPLRGLTKALLSEQRSVHTLLSFVVRTAPAATLGLSDYPHVARHLDTLLPFLDHAVRARVAGVNILLHGEPGVGKTEFGRLVAQKLGFTVFEVMVEDASGDALDSSSRQSSFRLLQGILGRRRRSVVLFDEMEDVTPYEGRHIFDSGDRKSGRRKAWMNRLLETNPIPTIWISNRVQHVDTSFLRRFAYVIKVDAPPKAVRRRMLERGLRAFSPSATFLDRVSEHPGLSPACVSAIGKVLGATGTDSSSVESRYDLLARERMEVLGCRAPSSRYSMPARWDPNYINASVDPVAMGGRLRDAGRGNLLLYGPPGSGKTALAHWLAESLQRPLLVKRASDLHAPYFGETEQLLGGMFREADKDGAVLFLDEADSFLFDRRGAQRSWEVAHVNELLTQMECFDGYFICATNFLGSLDSAAMRRFALKVRFDWMRPDQAAFAFRDTLAQLGIRGTGVEEALRKLAGIAPLAAGDFKAASQAVRLAHQAPTAALLVEALREQCEARERPATGIGFVSQP